MRFVWDQEKSQRNRAKHKVSFELAKLVFDDPFISAYWTLTKAKSVGEPSVW